MSEQSEKSDELDDLIEEFLDYCQYFGMPSSGPTLAFNTRLEHLAREEAREIIRQFIFYAREEGEDPINK